MTCDKCGGKVTVIMTPDGRKITCDAAPVHYKADGNGRHLFYSLCGDAVQGILTVAGMDAKQGYAGHLATCNARQMIKKGADKGVQVRMSGV